MTTVRFIARSLCLLSVPLLLLGFMVAAASDAEAGRRIVRSGARAAIPLVRNSSSEEPASSSTVSDPEETANEEATTEPAGGSAATAREAVDERKDSSPDRVDRQAPVETPGMTQPVRAAVAAPKQFTLPEKPKDISVPGCAPGHYCTVCIAGCSAGTDVIISVIAKGSAD